MCVIIRKIQVACLFLWRRRKKVFHKKQCFGIGGGKEKKADLNSLQNICSKLSESRSVTPAIERGQVWDP